MYKAILFHPAGDYATDFTDSEDVQSVWSAIEDMGSRWIFYPIPFVCTDKTIIDTCEGLEFLKGKRIATVKKFLAKEWAKDADGICDALNEGAPLDCIYNSIT